MILRTLAACTLLTVLTGCSTPKQLADTSRWSLGYRVDVQQGNVITQDMLAQLQPGMDKKKVTLLMGAPIIQDTFHKDRWDYIYTFQKGRHQAKRRHVTLLFEDDKLVKVTGDVVAASGPIAFAGRKDEQVDVPAPAKPNVVYRTMNAIPFIGDKPRKAKAQKADEDEALIVRAPVLPPEVEPMAGPEPATSEAPPPPPTEARKPLAAKSAAAKETPSEAKKKPGFFKRLFTRNKKEDADEADDGMNVRHDDNPDIQRPDEEGPDSAPHE